MIGIRSRRNFFGHTTNGNIILISQKAGHMSAPGGGGQLNVVGREYTPPPSMTEFPLNIYNHKYILYYYL